MQHWTSIDSRFGFHGVLSVKFCKNQLGEVDLVIGVLTRERRSEWVLFELSQAWRWASVQEKEFPARR
jgi:hypothetical protein